MRNNRLITEPFVRMRIKIALPTTWCQMHSDSPYQWLKGRIIEMPNADTIVVSIWSRRVGRIDRMMCFRDKASGAFSRIIRQKR